MRRILSLALVLGSSTALANTPAAPVHDLARTESTKNTAAIGVNMPLAWLDQSVGLTLYVGVTKRTALRFNAAYVDTWGDLLLAATEAETEGAPGHESYRRTLDLGVGYQFHVSERFRGLSFEIGALYRERDRQRARHPWDIDYLQSETKTIAARPMLGYTWRGSQVFMSIALGASFGYQRGVETDAKEVYTMTGTELVESSSRIRGVTSELEAYWRFGVII